MNVFYYWTFLTIELVRYFGIKIYEIMKLKIPVHEKQTFPNGYKYKFKRKVPVI